MVRLYRAPVGAAAASTLVKLAAVAALAAAASVRFSSPSAALAVALVAALSCAHTTGLAGLGTFLASALPWPLSSLFPGIIPPLLRGPRIYLRDFAAWRPPLLWFVDTETVMQTIEMSDRFDEEASVFMRRICERSGLGPATAMSPGIIAMRTHGGKSTKAGIAGGAAGGAIGESDKSIQLGRAGLQDALDETKTVMFEVCRDLFAKTGIDPTSIDAVFTSCSCFAPTPSMAAMIVNEFGMRRDILTYSLAGMGCSSSLVCVDAAMHMLRGLPRGSNVLIVNHENITANWYDGRDRSMLVTNCLFRAGGAAAIMTNYEHPRNKYELLDSERAHAGRDDDAFGCMGTGVDADGTRGVFLKSNVVEVAGRTLGQMLERLGPRALPAGELFKAAVARARASLSPSRDKKIDGAPAARKHVPDFSRAFDHFVLHTGGQAVLDALQKALNLSEEAMAPSRDTLHRYGNTSSASTWYTLAHCESGIGLGLDGGAPVATRRAFKAAKDAAIAAGKDPVAAAAAAAAAMSSARESFPPVPVPRRRVGVRRGERCLQLGFGGGFKACGAVWRATRDITESHPVWEEGFVDMDAVNANVARQLAEADAREAAREAAEKKLSSMGSGKGGLWKIKTATSREL